VYCGISGPNYLELADPRLPRLTSQLRGRLGCLAAGDGAEDDEGLGAIGDAGGKRGVRGIVREVLGAGEECGPDAGRTSLLSKLTLCHSKTNRHAYRGGREEQPNMKCAGDDSPLGGAYVLGHSGRELDRLIKQARLIDPITRRFLQAAGIAAGMRVLDVGSGAGDVAFMAAELVGDRGEVVGMDRSAAALTTAKLRARARPLGNVDFREGDPAEIAFDRPFDAVIGRYVLLFQGDPAAMVRRLAGHVRPGGVIFFHEPDWDGVRSFPPAPTHDRCCGWIRETLRLSGVDTRMGTNLFSTFVAAGLPAPAMQLETLVAGGANNADSLRMIADLADSLAAEMERLGVATAAELGLETLAERMISEAAANGSVVLSRFEVGAWSRVGSPARAT